MKVIVLHGDHLEKVAKRLTKFIDAAYAREWKIERLSNSEGLGLREVLSSTSLFKETKLFILDDIKKVNKTDLTWLKKNNKNLEGTLIVVNSGLLTKTALSSLPKPDKVEILELPKSIWAYLDSFYPGNAKRSLILLHEVLEKEAIELIIFLLTRHLRDLYVALVSPDILSYPSWRVGKLVSQAERFTENQLKEIISEMAEADYNAKTGEGDLVVQLDLIIATKLE